MTVFSLRRGMKLIGEFEKSHTWSEFAFRRQMPRRRV